MVDVLETGDAPILFSLPQMRIWVRLLNWILKETRSHAQLLACFPLRLSIQQWDILYWT